MPIEQDVKIITQTLEKVSKRLRRVEVLARLGRDDTAQSFLELDDTPDSYAGQRGWIPVVNVTEDGLRFGLTEGVCVAFECGAPGWRATGGSPTRTLVHETAFQLSDYGDDRGENAVDLQTFHSAVDQVAAGNQSAILGGLRNRITDSTGGTSSEVSSVYGADNELDDAYDCHVRGSSHSLINNSYAVHVHGENVDVDDVTYGFFAGVSHEAAGAGASGNGFGIFTLGESNDFVSVVANDDPTYCGSFGILNVMTGDIFDSFQFGESNVMLSNGGAGNNIWNCVQMGYSNYMSERLDTNYQFGRNLGSYIPPGLSGDFFNGRMLFDGDASNESSSNTPGGRGFNQNSIFGQNTAINTWPSSWTTSRFEFPVIEDSIWFFHVRIAGAELGCANIYSWEIEGVVQNDGGTTSIIKQIVSNFHRDVATKEWQVIADDTNDRLVFQFRDTAGPDATRCNIEFEMMTSEVGHES